MKLHVDADELASCVACGLCLPHCPTFRVTGEELLSPRGRIAAMRAVDAGMPASDGFLRSVDTCVQCLGCETACPSGVPFGHLMEATREAIATEVRTPHWWLRAALWALGHRRVLHLLTTSGAVAQRLHLVPDRLARRAGLPHRLPLRRARLEATTSASGFEPAVGDVWLFTGCVMHAWQRSVHRDVVRVLATMGVGVALPGGDAACCGALHAHSGLGAAARRLAERTMGAFPGDALILVDSAGCGAALKDYGHILGTPQASRFSARVRDVNEWLAEHVEELPPAVRALGPVAVQDPCHLRHAQRVHTSVRVVLAPYAEVVELDDEGLCCGAGGAYSIVQPGLAGQIRDRKVASIERAGAPRVASANPGCALHLSAAGLDVRHPVELVAEAAGLGER